MQAIWSLFGVCIDQEFGERLRLKFNQNLEDIDVRIEQELEALSLLLQSGRAVRMLLTELSSLSLRRLLSLAKLEEKYPYVDEKQVRDIRLVSLRLNSLVILSTLHHLHSLLSFYDILSAPQ